MPRHSKRSSAPSSALPGERALITAIRARAAGSFRHVPLGIGDDCAVLRPIPAWKLSSPPTFRSNRYISAATGTHLNPPAIAVLPAGQRSGRHGRTSPGRISFPLDSRRIHRARPPARPAGRNKRTRSVSWTDRFLDGLLLLGAKYRVPLAGGDTAQSPQFDELGRRQSGLAAADIVLIGQVRRGQALLRSGARPGNVIYVTGALGGSAAELLALGRAPERFAELTKSPAKGAASHPHLFPEPRCRRL